MSLTTEQLRERMHKALKETVRLYGDHPERTSRMGVSCCYLSDNGNMCAVGRMLDKRSKHYQEVVEDHNTDAVVELDTFFEGLDGLLKPRYRGLSADFLERLQEIHDRIAIDVEIKDNLLHLPTLEAQIKSEIDGGTYD